MRTARRVAAIALLATSLPAAAAQAAPTPGMEKQFFRVEVKGKQTTTWSQFYAPQGQCDQGVTGSGSETATFRTPRSYRLPVQRIGKDYVLFGDEYGSEVGVMGKTTRTARMEYTPLDPKCHGTGGGEIAPPDCGTKRGAIRIGFGWNVSGRPGIVLTDGDILDFYKNCPLLGTPFPQLQDVDTGLEPIVARIPAKDLFDRSIGKHIVIGRGQRSVDNAGSVWTTKIRFEVTLKRTK
jgi:hypothetical protein